ncbi:MAG: response regulator transcription factor [Chryseolinea sp.]
MLRSLIHRSRHIMLYSLLMGVMVFLLKWLQWKYLVADYSVELYVGLIAVAFTGLGLWIATHLSQPKVQKVFVEKEVYLPQRAEHRVNEVELSKLNLTSREYEVLKLLTKGCSNAEIAEQLFLSLSTIKTHVSNLFVKMDVKSRMQAVQKANLLGIRP